MNRKNRFIDGLVTITGNFRPKYIILDHMVLISNAINLAIVNYKTLLLHVATFNQKLSKNNVNEAVHKF